MARRRTEAQLERDFQAYLIKQIKKLYPGCIVLKNDSGYLQGVPDLTIFFKDQWAVLEVKASATSDEEPNQGYYVAKMNEMSFAAFIYPENEEEVLYAMEQAFRSKRPARVPLR